MTPEAYMAVLVDALTEAAAEAWTGRKTGGISPAFGYAVVGHNRRTIYNNGTAMLHGGTRHPMFASIEGNADHGVELLYLWDEHQELTGVCVNVPCPAQVLENEPYITADYWGEVRKQINDRFQKQLFILPLTGASGDISPREDLICRASVTNEANLGSEEGMVMIGRRISGVVDDGIIRLRNKIFRWTRYSSIGAS